MTEIIAPTKLPKPVDTPYGAIIYSDGGSRNGAGGFGIHGYIYSDQPPKKGSGCATQYLTAAGYQEKGAVLDKASVEEVKPLYYIDGHGSFAEPVSNNVAEMVGAIEALKYSEKYDLKTITILSDSEQVIKGCSEWRHGWKQNNWNKSDGTQVANLAYWKQLDSQINNLLAQGREVNFKWVKGHSTNMGNNIADKHATIGVFYSKKNVLRQEADLENAEGYWKNTVDKNPLVAQKRLYFCTLPHSIVPGQYYLGDHGKDDELLGKRITDGYFSYVELKEPDPAIELLRNKQVADAKGADSIIMARLDKLYHPDTHKDILNYGDICIYSPYRDKLDLHFIDKEPLTKELKPPRLAMRAIESVNALKGLLSAHQKGDTTLRSTDITDVIYDKDNKGNYKLKPEFIVGFACFSVSVKYGTEETLQSTVDLTLSVDLPDRNTIKKLEKSKPVVTVITWMESSKMFRHATIIKTQDDVGIYSGMYSNTKFVT